MTEKNCLYSYSGLQVCDILQRFKGWRKILPQSSGCMLRLETECFPPTGLRSVSLGRLFIPAHIHSIYIISFQYFPEIYIIFIHVGFLNDFRPQLLAVFLICSMRQPLTFHSQNILECPVTYGIRVHNDNHLCIMACAYIIMRFL
jgi:hypothetical protein